MCRELTSSCSENDRLTARRQKSHFRVAGGVVCSSANNHPVPRHRRHKILTLSEHPVLEKVCLPIDESFGVVTEDLGMVYLGADTLGPLEHARHVKRAYAKEMLFVTS